MLRNYLIIAWRNLWNNKVFSLINIVGLSVAMTACLLIYLYISFEGSFDTFHKKKSNIYRYTFLNIINGVKELPQSTSFAYVGPFFKSNFPEIEEYARLHKVQDPVFSNLTDDNEKQIYREEKVFYADPAFLDIFTFPLLIGNYKDALSEPNCIVITESMANKYFNWSQEKKNAIEILDQNIILNNNVNLKITGVIEDLPPNSHIKFNALISMATLLQWRKNFDEIPVWTGTINYFKIAPNTDLDLLEQKVMELFNVEFGEMMKKFSTVHTFQLQPIDEIHLHSSDFMRETEVRGNIQTIRFLMIIGMIILSIAWINYMNLTTARAIKRAKEVCLKKILGAGKKQLIQQFLLEAIIVNITAVFLAMTLVQIVLPYFEKLVDKDLQYNVLSLHQLYIGLGFLLIGIFISGFYPALLLSSIRPFSLMNGLKIKLGKNVHLRKALVVFQFIITFGLILGTMVVYRQVSYMQRKELGFNIEKMFVIRAPLLETNDTRNMKYKVLKNKLLSQSAVTAVTASYNIPGGDRIGDSYFMSKINNQKVRTPFPVNSVDIDFFDTYNMKMKYGRKFLQGDHNDQNSIIITEQTARDLGYEDPVEAMNEIIYNAFEDTDQFKDTPGVVINPVVVGILKDFNQNSLKTRVEGMIFQKEDAIKKYRLYRYYTLRLQLQEGSYDGLTSIIDNIEKIYKEVFNEDAFSYFFLDDFFNRQYQSERKFGTYFSLFSTLAITIACLGLFGLSLFTLQQRTKEVGIRKVNGASIQRILILLSNDFIKLIIISVLIGTPIAFILLKKWLQGYEYRIHLSLWIFLLSALIVTAIALFTISYQSLKAALANPVKALRYE